MLLARSYSSSLGRFQSPDPEEGDPSNPQTWNRYAYVGNDVINVTDPSGKDWLTDLVIGAMIFADLIDEDYQGVFAGIGQSTGIPVFNAEDEGCNFSSGSLETRLALPWFSTVPFLRLPMEEPQLMIHRPVDKVAQLAKCIHQALLVHYN